MEIALGRQCCSGEAMLLGGGKCCSGEAMLLWGGKCCSGVEIALGRQCCSGDGNMLWEWKVAWDRSCSEASALTGSALEMYWRCLF
ncbi:MAG TPA: hypothetical protein P5543_07330 [Planctomycetota bacterium]|nr:hypothetical protein [Planctomycetota bacterium]